MTISDTDGSIGSQELLLTGLHIYDNVLGFLISVCELLSMLKEKRYFSEEYQQATESVMRDCQGILKDLMKKAMNHEITQVSYIDKLLEKIECHIRDVLRAIEYQEYKQAVKDYSLAKEILPFLPTHDEQFTALGRGFNDILYLQQYVQGVLHNKAFYCYIDHLMPSAGSIFRRGELVAQQRSLSACSITEKDLKNAGGFCDIFNVDGKIVANSILGMCSLMLEIRNQSKIFFDEVKVKVEVEGMRISTHHQDIVVDNFAPNSCRKLKLCFHKSDFSTVSVNLQVWSHKLVTITSDNPSTLLLKLDTLAATRDIFEKKYLAWAKGLTISRLAFCMPLNLQMLPLQTLRLIEQRQMFPIVCKDESTATLPAASLQSHVMENRFIASSVIVINSNPPIVVKDNLTEAVGRLQSMANDPSKPLSFSLMTVVTQRDAQIAVSQLFEKSPGSSVVKKSMAIKSDTKDVAERWLSTDVNFFSRHGKGSD